MALHQINIRISAVLLKAIQREAKVQGVSLSHIGRVALTHYITGEAGYNRRTK
jgi:predicted DNA binding CopG/RHH family protein